MVTEKEVDVSKEDVKIKLRRVTIWQEEGLRTARKIKIDSV